MRRRYRNTASGANTAITSRDGPVLGMVAEVAAQLAHAEGDDTAAVELLATALVRRGTLDHGSAEVVALLAALGPHAEERIAAAVPRAGAATLTAFLLADPPIGEEAGHQVRRR